MVARSSSPKSRSSCRASSSLRCRDASCGAASCAGVKTATSVCCSCGEARDAYRRVGWAKSPARTDRSREIPKGDFAHATRGTEAAEDALVQLCLHVADAARDQVV